jgi:cardiolipin synthase
VARTRLYDGAMEANPTPRLSWREQLTVPNIITLARIGLIVVFGVLLVRSVDGWAITVLAVAGASDFVDGFLARKLGQTSELGRFLDPAADRLLTVVVVLGLAWRDIIPWWLVVLLLSRDVVMGIALLWWRRRGAATPRVTFLGKSATFALYVSLPLSYLAYERWEGVHSFAIVAAAVSSTAYWGSALQYLAQLRRSRSRAQN